MFFAKMVNASRREEIKDQDDINKEDFGITSGKIKDEHSFLTEIVDDEDMEIEQSRSESSKDSGEK